MSVEQFNSNLARDPHLHSCACGFRRKTIGQEVAASILVIYRVHMTHPEPTWAALCSGVRPRRSVASTFIPIIVCSFPSVHAHRRDVVRAHKMYDWIVMDRHGYVILGQAYRKLEHMREYQACDPTKL
jgi:hypothetical protein